MEDLGFAKLDTHRELRQGLPETIYAEGQDAPTDRHHRRTECLRPPPGRYRNARPVRHGWGTVGTLARSQPPRDRACRSSANESVEPLGLVAVVAAGTSDLPVAEEAAVVAEACGLKVERVTDVGVAGLHRILAARAPLDEADVVIVVAGMEGALPEHRRGSYRNTCRRSPHQRRLRLIIRGAFRLVGDAELLRRRSRRLQHRQRLRRRDVRSQADKPSVRRFGARPVRLCYFDCFAGAAGDMLLGALLDAGADESAVTSAIGSLGIDGWALKVGEASRRGFRATQVTIEAPDQKIDRNLSDIEALLNAAELDVRVREMSRQAFRALGHAEARVHGVDIVDVHFHEVGALDTIVDVVGTCAAFVDLGIERAMAGPVAIGSGTVETDHGTIPFPAPAVTELLRQRERPCRCRRSRREADADRRRVALIFALDAFGPVAPMRVEATGYGAGQRDTELPNVVAC